MTHRPTDIGKELGPDALTVGTDYYVQQLGSYVRLEVTSIVKNYYYATVHGIIPSRNEPRVYIVPRHTPPEIHFFEIVPKLATRIMTSLKSFSPIPMKWFGKGGYRATARDKKYLARLRAGKSIGFTMRASLKAKGLLPRANGSKRVSEKYRAQKRNVTRRRT